MGTAGAKGSDKEPKKEFNLICDSHSSQNNYLTPVLDQRIGRFICSDRRVARQRGWYGIPYPVHLL